MYVDAMRGSKGEGGGGAGCPNPLLKNHKNRAFSNTGPDPLKNTKLPSQHSMLDQQKAILNAVSLAGR